jgi:aspartyl-tRNA(Asn)/glutamyl-tRNA(Gln) amidotransferase subunit A
LGGLTTAGVIGADLDDVMLATSVVSGPHRLDPTALPHWPVPVLADGPWRVAYLSTLGRYAADPGVDRVVRERLTVADVIDVPLELLPTDDAWQALAALDAGRGVEAAEVQRARAVRDHNNTALADLFEVVDALITPTTLTVAHGYDQHNESIIVGDPCWAFNVTGHPAVSVPVGLSDGLPVGAQVVARYGDDATALAVARRLQVELPDPAIVARPRRP